MSADELLSVGESLSPMTKWMRKHSLVVVAEDPDMVGQESPETGFELAAYYCMKDDRMVSSQHLEKIGRGASPSDACLDWCLRNGVRSWSFD
jgi:hypothetical protein